MRFSVALLVRRTALLVLAFATLAGTAAEPDVEERYRQALRLARESNNRELVAAAETLGRQLRSGSAQDTPARLADLERRVGIDPGGWSMAGQAIFHPTAAIKAQLPELAAELTAALRTDDPAAVTAVTRKMLGVLGDQAGLPDARRGGRRGTAPPVDEAAATRLFLTALHREESRLRPLLRGQPLPDQMVRLYGYLLSSYARIRPLALRHSPAEVAWLDRMGEGAANVLLALQQAGGYFPFPDLRGKNVRFGDMTEKGLTSGSIEVRDGWIVSVDPDGGSQFDTGVAGTALLIAGRERAHAAWIQAGRRAADWALTQRCCANFNYNAFSVSLLAQAYAVTGETAYLQGAWRKFQVGVAPGQAPNGRWLDAHNARTVYHVIILRALADLASVLPPDWKEQRTELQAVTRPAVDALLHEFEALGVTVDALPELLALRAVYPEDPRLRAAANATASGILDRCTDGRRVKLGASPEQLAAVAMVAP